MRSSVTALLFLCLIICATFADETKPIYGIDERTEEYQLPVSLAKTLGGKTGAMMVSGAILENEGFFSLAAGPDLQTAQNLCDGEPFGNQPLNAFCSGTLIAPNLFLTAGHCVREEGASQPNDLSNVYVVFGYVMLDTDKVKVDYSETEVYKIASVPFSIYDETTDIAVVQLESNVVGISPVNLFGYYTEVIDGDEILMVGHPSGIPRKYDIGDIVEVDVDNHKFFSSLDAYHGNSGSGVFNDAGELIAVLVSGSEDFLFNPDDNCYVDYECGSPDESYDYICDGEKIQSICVLPASFGVPACNAIRPSITPTISITPSKTGAPSVSSASSSTPTRAPIVTSPSSSRAPFTNSGDSSSSSSGSSSSGSSSSGDNSSSSASMLFSSLFGPILVSILLLC